MREKCNQVKKRISRELYDFRPPHKVLCDESYVNSFSKFDTKTQVANSLKEFIRDKMKLFITSCLLHSSQNFKGVLPRGCFLAGGSDWVEENMNKSLFSSMVRRSVTRIARVMGQIDAINVRKRIRFLQCLIREVCAMLPRRVRFLRSVLGNLCVMRISTWLLI